MSIELKDVSNPPRTYFSVWQRLLRGYGPLAALVIVLLLTAYLVPSKAKTADVSTGGGSSTGAKTTGGTGTGAGTGAAGTGGTADAGAAGGGTAGGGGGGGGGEVAGAGVASCSGDQVNGDPYSPPCITFSGDNGGNTYTGVNATEIHISYRVLNEKGFQQTLAAIAGASLVDTPADLKRTVDALVQFFNNNYQFYGRKIVMDYYDGKGSNTSELLGKGRDLAEADADTVQQMGSFAELSATSEPYANALSKRGIMGFGDPYLSVQWHDEHAPYIWSIATAGTQVANFAAEYAVKKLCGGNATHADGVDSRGAALKDRPRKFASFAPDNSWYQESVLVARDTFTAAGCEPGENVAYRLDLGTMSDQATRLITQMQDAGVTTMLCGCDPIIPVFLSGVANRQNYFPEFIIVGTALTDFDVVGQLWNQSFAKHAFGVSPLTAPQPAQASIGYAAYKSVAQDEPAFSVELIYYQMAQMAIGLQMAGPNLTPQSFEQGMFSYPPKLGPAGVWGFGPHDYTTSDDVREIYWDPNAISNYNQKQGAYIELNGGARYRQGEIPAGLQVPVPQ